MARSMHSAWRSSQSGRIALSRASAFTVALPATISETMSSRPRPLSRSRRLESMIALPDRQATTTKAGTKRTSTKAIGCAMTKVRIRNKTANGRSHTISAEVPDSVLRTTSTSRKSACQCAAGRDSSVARGSAMNLSKRLRPPSRRAEAPRAARCALGTAEAPSRTRGHRRSRSPTLRAFRNRRGKPLGRTPA